MFWSVNINHWRVNSLPSRCNNLEWVIICIGLIIAHDAPILLRASFGALVYSARIFKLRHQTFAKIRSVTLNCSVWNLQRLIIWRSVAANRFASKVRWPWNLSTLRLYCHHLHSWHQLKTRDLQNKIFHTHALILDNIFRMFPTQWLARYSQLHTTRFTSKTTNLEVKLLPNKG